jgi:hypothetical protein
MGTTGAEDIHLIVVFRIASGTFPSRYTVRLYISMLDLSYYYDQAKSGSIY